jgi:hypothetical protein
MTASAADRQRTCCPALIGQATDMTAAPFTLHADDRQGDDGQAVTEILGFFQFPWQEPEDLVHVDGFVVPAASPVGDLARTVAADPELARIAGERLRAAITACQCVPEAGCPAFDDICLLEAIEHAAGNAPC